MSEQKSNESDERRTEHFEATIGWISFLVLLCTSKREFSTEYMELEARHLYLYFGKLPTTEYPRLRIVAPSTSTTVGDYWDLFVRREPQRGRDLVT
jgi:hypothetical protein